MKNNKIKMYNIGIILCLISIFVFPRSLRKTFMGNFSYFNILFYLGIILFLKNNKIKKNSGHRVRVFISFAFFSLLSIITIVSQSYASFAEKIGYIVINCLPVFLVNDLLFYDDEKFAVFANKWYKTLYTVCLLLVFSWFIDQFTNKSIQRFIANFYQSASLIGNVEGNRFISIYGHALTNASLMFSLLLWTLTTQSNYKKNNKYIIAIIISIFGISITGSKSILFFAIVLLLINFLNKKNFKYIFPTVIVASIMYKFGVFDLTIGRISHDLEYGDMSSGRNTWLTTLTKNGILQFNLIKGHFLDESIRGLIAALEYPILRWAYKTGIIFAFILTINYFLIPIKTIIINNMKNIRFILSIIIYMLVVNVNDSLTSNCDTLIMYVMNICLLNYLVKSKKIA